MEPFDSAFQYALSKECSGDEVTNNPNDLGGITKYGISLRLLRSISQENLHKYGVYSTEPDDIVNLTLEQAKNIYYGEFWQHAKFECISNSAVRNHMFAGAINMGINPVIKCAQRACWSVLNSRGHPNDDGILGNDTISQINISGSYLLPCLKAECASYYRSIVDRHPEQQEFLNGWLNRAYGA